MGLFDKFKSLVTPDFGNVKEPVCQLNIDGSEEDEHYVDPDGAPEDLDLDLYQDLEFCASRPEKVLGCEDGDVEWLRPGEICESPTMFSGGSSQFDVVQGSLGDCWLLAAMAPLSMNEALLKRVCPEQSFDAGDG